MGTETNRDDNEWICAALDQYEGPLIRYAHRFLGSIESARDVVQDTFLKLCAERSQQVRDHLPAWLFRVCRNRALDVLRKENRMSQLEDTELAVLENQSPSPSEQLDNKQKVHHVYKALGGLPSNQQEVIRLKFQEGLSYREISKITGHSISHVGVLIHAGMKTLRQRLSHDSLQM